MSQAHEGKCHTEDARKKISDSLKQQWKQDRREKHQLVSYKCKNCGKEFSVIHARFKRGIVRFCSKACQYKYMIGQVFLNRRRGQYKTCPVCTNQFYVYPYEVNDRLYCSPKCYTKVEGIYSRSLWKRPEYVKKVMGKLHSRPSRPEKKVIDIVKNENFPLKYVGDGSLVIGGLNPDFIHTEGKKKVVEVFGRVFHDPQVAIFGSVNWKRQYFGRMSCYSQLGYDCLILWDDELRKLDHVVEKLRDFVYD
ncbi:hypothetical protein MUP77_07085 [Candidatus Bathyarchaeota archaeon]|nr:hypothetical protein [Candidatus Bathyarchaeota archaeon]